MPAQKNHSSRNSNEPDRRRGLHPSRCGHRSVPRVGEPDEPGVAPTTGAEPLRPGGGRGGDLVRSRPVHGLERGSVVGGGGRIEALDAVRTIARRHRQQHRDRGAGQRRLHAEVGCRDAQLFMPYLWHPLVRSAGIWGEPMVPNEHVRRRLITFGVAFVAATAVIAIVATPVGAVQPPQPKPVLGAPPAGVGLGSKAALAQDNCDPERKRTNYATVGGGPFCVNPWKAGQGQRGRDRARGHGDEREGARAHAELRSRRPRSARAVARCRSTR